MFENPNVRNVLKALLIAVFGFALLNLTLMVDFAFQSLVDLVLRLFASVDANMDISWYPALKHILFVIVIGLISWPILRSKIRPIIKATYLMVPTAVLFVTIGIFLYRWPVAVYLLSVVIGLGVLYYFYKTKKNWMYWFSFILLALSLAAFSLTGGQI